MPITVNAFGRFAAGDSFAPYDDYSLKVVASIVKNGEILLEANVGRYDCGYEEGSFICKSIRGNEVSVGIEK